ncbi:MAG TPA: hypothetical protein VEQ59_11795 [Polyangiaceae bacterium]|nr:hypothetical protein [Polyangiaceae bacterium]
MSASAEARPQATALLTIRGASGAWAVPSSAVSSIEPCSDAPCIDVLTRLGITASAVPEAARVLVLHVAGRELRLLARGALALNEAGPDSLLPLPRALALSAPLVSHVALVDGKPSIFVVSPERLLLALGGPSSVPPPFETLPEAPSC